MFCDALCGVRNMIRKFIRFGRNNAIVNFWLSYIVMLIIPVMVIMIGIAGAFIAVKNEISESNLIKMEHSIQLIDNELDILESSALQMTGISSIKSSALLEYVNGINMLQFKKGIDELMNLSIYQKDRLVDKFYLYYNKLDYIVYEGALYQGKLFYQMYLPQWGLGEEEWKEEIVCDNILRSMYRRSSADYFHFIIPINSKLKNDGAMVFVLDQEKILNYFSFAEEFGESALYILDENNQVLTCSDYQEDRVLDFSQEDLKSTFRDVKKENLLIASSDKRGWSYCLILPKGTVAHGLFLLMWLSIAAGTITILTGLIISFQLALRVGKPMNQIFSVMEDRGTKEIRNVLFEKTPNNLLKSVTGMVDENREMQREIEKNQPLLKKAFFHDLITLDVANDMELEYLKENAQIHFTTNRFRLVSVKLFANNDFFDIDEQTLQDGKVILWSIQKHIEECVGGNVWFYQRNYLSMLFLLEEEEEGKAKETVEEAHSWLMEAHSIESEWGISSECRNIMNLWKYCEEAETARDRCKEELHVMEYSADFVDKQAYYFPDVAEERIYNGICSGDMAAVNDSLEILEKENFINRKLNRKNLLQLNIRLIRMLELFEKKEAGVAEHIMHLNQIVTESEHPKENYMKVLREACNDLREKLYQEKRQQRNALLESIKEYIGQHYMDSSLGLATISVNFRISEGYVSILFKKHSNVNFADYVESIRLNKACEMLKESDSSIETIAGMVGYNSVQSFRRAFKRVYNMSPKEYR